jgi:beta-1,4-mannooligosaccharide phosphorylase
LTPITPDETEGVVDNVVFPPGIDVVDGRTLDVYYGMADARIGVARVHVREEAAIPSLDANRLQGSLHEWLHAGPGADGSHAKRKAA